MGIATAGMVNILPSLFGGSWRKMSRPKGLVGDPFPNENRALAWTAKTLYSSDGGWYRTRTCDLFRVKEAFFL